MHLNLFQLLEEYKLTAKTHYLYLSLFCSLILWQDKVQIHDQSNCSPGVLSVVISKSTRLVSPD